MLGLGVSLVSEGSENEEFSRTEIVNLLQTHMAPDNSTVTPLTLESNNSISFDDTTYEGAYWEIGSGATIYDEVYPSAVGTSGDIVTISGRITERDSPDVAYQDTNNDGFFRFYIDGSNYIQIQVDSGYSGIESKVSKSGYFNKSIILTGSMNELQIVAYSIHKDGEPFNSMDSPGVLISNLSLLI